MPSPPPPSPSMIGDATMDENGTLILNLRAISGATKGIGQLRYPLDHPQYLYILKHLSPIAPGDTVPVKPFPEEPPPQPKMVLKRRW